MAKSKFDADSESEIRFSKKLFKKSKNPKKKKIFFRIQHHRITRKKRLKKSIIDQNLDFLTQPMTTKHLKSTYKKLFFVIPVC